VEKLEGGVRVALQDGSSIEADQVLVAINFQPNVENLGLDIAGVQLTERGNIVIDKQMRTNVPNIYAVGDVATDYRLAHIASAMGIVAAEIIAEHDTVELDYKMMPRCTYSVPQVASFGYTESQAEEAGYEVKVGRFPFQANGKALGMGERDGFIKIVADAKYGEILGAHLVGPDVTELLPELTLAHNAELTAEEIARNVHAHPTLSEALMEAAHGVEGEPIHA
jgi:dihydrolipoamide dehydrogenase